MGTTTSAHTDVSVADESSPRLTATIAELVSVTLPVGTTAEIVPVPSAALVRARERVALYRQSTKAVATQRAYKADWNRFYAWAARMGVMALPASPDTVAQYMTGLAEEGYSVAAIERFLSAAGHYHKQSRLDWNRGAIVISESLQGIRNRHGTASTPKAPLELDELVTICNRPGLSARDRAILTVGWFGMLRSANLVAIEISHLSFVRMDGKQWWVEAGALDGLIIRLPKSKTDQIGAGRDVPIHAQANKQVCPVRALDVHLRESGITSGCIFPVSRRYVSRLVKQVVADPAHNHAGIRAVDRCETCSAAAERFASHSLRRGHATTQGKRGTEERDIMRHGGWKSERVMRGYIEYGSLFERNPTKDLAPAVVEATCCPSPTRPS